MADKSLIEWTDATWNPITGCSIVSPGCTHCYAMKLAGTRLQHHPTRQGLTRDSKAGPVWTGEVRFNEKQLLEPLRWSRPRKIFVCAHGDLFAKGVADEWIDKVFAVMALCPQHTFQVLTKRPERMREYLRGTAAFDRMILEMMVHTDAGYPTVNESCERHGIAWSKVNSLWDWWPLRNVWLGVSAEDQQRADERIPALLDAPAAMRFVSLEPLLGPIDLTRQSYGGWPMNALAGVTQNTVSNVYPIPALDWVIVGGESGDGARPMHPNWALSLMRQCKQAGVAFFFKQHGAWAPVSELGDEQIDRLYKPAPGRDPEATRKCLVEHIVMDDDGTRHGPADALAYSSHSAMLMFRTGKAKAGRLLRGVEHNGMPDIGGPP